VRNQAALYALIAAWAATLPLATAMAQLVAADVPASPLMSIADIAHDPHFRERGTIVPIEDEEYGSLLMTAPIPRMSETPGTVRSLGPVLGSGNQAVLGGLLGMSDAEIAALRDAKVI
jgi:crotonobetainyl-CoA:carnitine CoA-transferase CaiB-like acyl-CoA transferase